MRLRDLIEVSLVRELAEASHEASGMPIGVVDASDGSIVVALGWHEGPEGRDLLEPPAPETPWERSCQHGLREIAMPIVVAGQRLATLFLGHFAYQGEAPRRELLDPGERELGRDAEARAAASDRVPTFTRSAVEDIVAYDRALVRFLAGLAEGALSHAAERKEAEERLRISEQRLRLGMRASRTAFFDADLEAGELSQEPRFHGWPDLPVLVRGSPEEISAALFAPEDLPRVLEVLRPLLDGTADQACLECRRNQRRGRGWVRCSIAVAERDARGRARRLCGSAMEITEWRELQERITRAERVASVGALVRGLSHEINNPLASVIANLSYAHQQLEIAPPRAREAWTDGPDSLDDLCQALRDAAEAAQRIRVLVMRLRTFTPGNSRELRCELRGAVDDALRYARSELAACAEVSFELPAALEIAVDPVDLVEVLTNLLANAGQATGPRPNRVRVTAELQDGARVAIRVSDTGTGIDPEIAPRVFDPFFSTRSVGEGAGLGLSVCQGIVWSAGGEIAIDSTPGEGTVVTVVLPSAPPPGD